MNLCKKHLELSRVHLGAISILLPGRVRGPGSFGTVLERHVFHACVRSAEYAAKRMRGGAGGRSATKSHPGTQSRTPTFAFCYPQRAKELENYCEIQLILGFIVLGIAKTSRRYYGWIDRARLSEARRDGRGRRFSHSIRLPSARARRDCLREPEEGG